MKLFTIGFTKKNAESFFTALQRANVMRLLDVRLNNRSQLAGFSKSDDLRYFLGAIADIEYQHLPELAPTQEMLDAYKKHDGSWSAYENQFVALLRSRQVETRLDKSLFEDACLLCSEHLPDHCHRRLVAEYLKSQWDDVSVEHLL